jgi:hypothetical protein
MHESLFWHGSSRLPRIANEVIVLNRVDRLSIIAAEYEDVLAVLTQTGTSETPTVIERSNFLPSIRGRIVPALAEILTSRLWIDRICHRSQQYSRYRQDK